LQPFPAESRGLHQNAQKLTGNTKNEELVIIKYSLAAGKERELLKSINISDIIQGCHDRIKVCKKANVTKLTETFAP